MHICYGPIIDKIPLSKWNKKKILDCIQNRFATTYAVKIKNNNVGFFLSTRVVWR